MPISSMGWIWSKFYPLYSTHFGFFFFFFADFHCNMSGNWINIYNLIKFLKIGKLFKNCSFRTLFKYKQGQNGPHPISNSIFCLKITKYHKLSRSFYFIKDWVVNDFLSCVIFCFQTSHFWLKQLYLPNAGLLCNAIPRTFSCILGINYAILMP